MARLQLFLLSLFLSFASTGSRLVNITVDDTFGDPTTGTLPEYLPNEETWNLTLSSDNCPSCGIDPSTLDLTQIYKQTWHDTMYLSVVTPATITVRFNGSAVYVFNVLGKVVPGAAMSNISFSIDGENVGQFIRSPESSADILYNQLVYHNTTLSDGPHTLVMTPADLTLMMFDYFLYTTQSDGTIPAGASSSIPQPPSISSSTTTPSTSNPDDPFHSSSTHTPPPVEGIVGGILGAHNNSVSLTPDVQLRGPDSALNASLRATVGGSPDSEPPAVPVDRSSKHRAELAQRLETLQRTRSVLSSQAPSESRRSPSEVSREVQGGTEAAMRDLEAEIARLRGILAAMNVPFVDGHDNDEPLPAYAE
ncbi:hypothetical protein V8D89_007063 [Ganoderma adspersum]